MSKQRQHTLSAWMLMAYPDDMFLSVFKSKVNDGIVYLGGSEVMHQIHKRLYDLDKDLYLELYGPEAMAKFENEQQLLIVVSEPKLKQDPNFPFDNMQVDMVPYNNLTFDKLIKSIEVEPQNADYVKLKELLMSTHIQKMEKVIMYLSMSKTTKPAGYAEFASQIVTAIAHIDCDNLINKIKINETT